MKEKLFAASCLLSFALASLAQAPETFDISTFRAPKGWNKQAGENSIQFSTEDKGNFCLVTLFKAIPGLGDPKENFDAAWETIVKEAVTVSSAPQMFPADTRGEWLLAGGFAPFEKNGEKGVAVLYTATGFGKMVNALVLTNTQAYEPATTAFLESISFKKPAGSSQPPFGAAQTGQSIPPQPTARKSSFKFNTSNFDDGWRSTEQEDWVEAVKGQIKVLIHYPKAGTIFPADPEPLTNAAWDILVAPRYSSLKNYKTAYITTYNRPYLGMGYAVERASGKQVFVLLFRQGDTGWLEFIA
ncbi:MAG TPA: hypothetical protein VL572_04775, partial [Pyrinomonadaceae bacterium]|nr:hypothetical protein [Pyrinomonadaceae bacterium]